IVSFLLLLLGIIGLKTIFKSPDTFTAHSKTDFYIISYGDVQGYRFKNNSLKQTSKDKIQLVKGQINPAVQRAEIDKRYLLFSEEGPPLGAVGRIIAMDFQKGTIKYNQTPDYAYSSSGISASYYFTSEASTDSTFLASFDSNLKEVSKYTFDEAVLGRDFSVDGNILYFLGTKVHGDGNYPTDLYKLVSDNGKVHLENVERLFETSDKTYLFGDNIVKNNNLYAAVNGYRINSTKERIPIGQMLTYDMQTGHKALIDLSEIAPLNIFDLGQDMIAIEHERNDSRKLGFSLFNLNNNSSSFIDLSTFGLSVETDYIKDVKRLNNDLLLILSGSQLLIYNTLTSQVVLQESSMSPDSFHIWVNRP
ncbi:hypothetical protein, partial [Streptococcus merionis]|uniref:hypothetical protein n=1 Tax=Streptococcus merionis TaxID=400065 RepID=UPI00350E500D